MPKLLEMEGVTGGEDGFPVELWRDDDTGRLVVLGYNEAGFNTVEFDLAQLVRWLQSPTGAKYAALGDSGAFGLDTVGNSHGA